MGRVTVIDDTFLPNRPGRCEADWFHDLEFEIFTSLSEADMALVAQATVRLLVDNYPYPLIDDDLFQRYWKCVPCLAVEVPTTRIGLLGGKKYGDPPGLCPDFFMSDETRLTLFVDFPDGISEAIDLVTTFRRWRYTTTPPLDCVLRPGAYYPRDARIIPVVSNCARTLDPVVIATSIPRAPDAAETSQPPRTKVPPQFAAVIDEPGCQAVPVEFLGCVDAQLQNDVAAVPLALGGCIMVGSYTGAEGVDDFYANVGSSIFGGNPTVEAEVQYRALRAGTIRNFRGFVSVNTTVLPATVTLNLNGAATPLTFLIPAGFTGPFDVAATTPVAVDDLVSVHLSNTDPAAGPILSVSYDMPGPANPTSVVVQGARSLSPGVFTAHNVGHNPGLPAFSAASAVAAELNQRYRTTHAGTLRRLKVRTPLNTLDGATTFTVRVNGVDTALTLSIPATTAGLFTFDATVVVAPGDLVSLVADTTPSTAGAMLPVVASYDFVS